MAEIDAGAREAICTVVYYGPASSGKTTNVERLYALAPAANRGEPASVTTEDDPEVLFDFLPLDLGHISGVRVRVRVFGVPGEAGGHRACRRILSGADGVVFVADSDPGRSGDNVASLAELAHNLAGVGIDIEQIPLVFQWNKRDLEGAMPVEEMNAALNRWNAPAVEAAAAEGRGVGPALNEVMKLVAGRLRSDGRLGS